MKRTKKENIRTIKGELRSPNPLLKLKGNNVGFD